MFTESLLDSRVPTRRRWTIVSFAVQIACIAALVLLPLFTTNALPRLIAISEIGPPPGPLPHPAGRIRQVETRTDSEVVGTTVFGPIHIPDHIAQINDQTPPQPGGDAPAAVFGSTGESRTQGGLMRDILAVATPRPPAAPPPRPIISGGVLRGYLLHKVDPVYPPLARMAHVEGMVVLNAVISRGGAIENLRVISGHPLLAKSAAEAVLQWRYRPYLLNNQPTEVETQITVNFTLARGQ